MGIVPNFFIQEFDGEISFIPNADTFPFLEDCMLKPYPRFVSFFVGYGGRAIIHEVLRAHIRRPIF